MGRLRALSPLGLTWYGAAILGLVPVAAAAQDAGADTNAPEQIATAVFAAHSPFRDPLLSPDGNRIAMRLTVDGIEHIAAMDKVNIAAIIRK